MWPVIPDARGKIIKQIDARGVIAAVLYEDGSLYNVGYNSCGQQAVGNTTQQNYFVKTADNVKRFWLAHNQSYSHSYTHWFHEKNDGTIWSVGKGDNGQLGLGTTVNINTWTQISFFDDKSVVNMWLGGAYYGNTIAELDDGTLWFSGYNGYGQAGNGSTGTISSFEDITTYWGGPTNESAGKIVDLSSSHGYYTTAGYSNSSLYMLREDGIVRTCGYNGYSNLGDGTTTQRTSPVSVSIPEPIIQLTLIGGAVGTIYVRSASNKVWRWGYNAYGQIGDGTTTHRSTPYNSGDPEDIDNNCNLILMNDTSGHTHCFVNNQFLRDNRNDQVWGVGDGVDFLLGNGDSADQHTFMKVFFQDDVNIVQCQSFGYGTGSHYTIWLDDKGRVWGTGDNGNYQLPYYGYWGTTSYPLPTLLEIK